MNQQIIEFFQLLNQPENNVVVFIVFIGLHLFAVLLRIVLFLGYQAQSGLFKISAKAVRARADIKDTKSGLLNRIIMDYMKAGDKSATRIPTSILVHKHVLNIRFLGWSCSSIEHLMTSLENSLLWVGILLTVLFEGYRYGYALAAIGFFFIMRMLISLLDVSLVRERMSAEITEYVDREVGQFFVGDINSAVGLFKNELTAVIQQQSDQIGESVAKLADDVAGSVRYSMQEMSKAVENTLKRVSEVDSLYRTEYNGLQKQLEYIEQNQQLLKESLHQYETSLEQLAGKVGDGLGSMVNFHMQNAYGTLNDSLQQNIKTILTSNQALLQQLQRFMENIVEQGSRETKAIAQLKEQIDLHFETLKR